MTPARPFSIFPSVRLESPQALEDVLRGIRQRLDAAFAPDTAVAGTKSGPASSGHCAAVALIVREAVGGDTVSALHGSNSHWFNRVPTERGGVDVDLTGDQFGLPAIRVGELETLYQGTRVRHPREARDETVLRAARLAKRARLDAIAEALDLELRRRGEDRA